MLMDTQSITDCQSKHTKHAITRSTKLKQVFSGPKNPKPCRGPAIQFRAPMERRLTSEPDIHQDMDPICQMEGAENHASPYARDGRVCAGPGDSETALVATTSNLVEHELTRK
jgi:hypothetical protein